MNFIGGADDKIKDKIKKSLIIARNECLQEAKDPSDPLDLLLMHDLLRCVKLMEITWSIKTNKEKYGKNSVGIDVVISRDNPQGDHHLFVRQQIKLINSVTNDKKYVCCGGLCYNLNNSNTTGQQLLLSGTKLFTADNLAEEFKAGKILFFSHQLYPFSPTSCKNRDSNTFFLLHFS